MKKIFLSFQLLSITLLCGCFENHNTDNDVTIELSTLNKDNYCYSIGSNELKPIDISDAVFELRETEKKLGKEYTSEVFSSISFLKDDKKTKVDNVLALTSAYGQPYKKIKDIANHLIFAKAINEFEKETIKYIEFKYDDYKILIECNVKLEYNNQYSYYPAFKKTYRYYDSYDWQKSSGLYPWQDHIFSNIYGFLDMRNIYDLNTDSIILNKISFSDNLSGLIKHIGFEDFYYNEKEEFVNWYLDLRDEWRFETCDESIDLSALGRQNRILVFMASGGFAVSEHDLIGGDIIFDVTINGQDYSIKDTFLY